uniref:Uncharacterized protein n=1 Tax=Rhizophora mucronata TaxID=61149 RepID=A0A2P2QKY7_RHIMU
MNLRSKMGNIN